MKKRSGTELDQWDYYRPSTKLMTAVADLRGGRASLAPPRGPKFFHFHAVFDPKNRFVHPLWELAPPPWGKSWIRHWTGNVFSHVCLSFCPHEGGSNVTITQDEIGQSQVTKEPPAPAPHHTRTSLAQALLLLSQYRYPLPDHVQTCSLHHTGIPYPKYLLESGRLASD